MKKRELVRRTPVRLAVMFSLLFAVILVCLSAVLYVGIGVRLESDIRHRVGETISALAALDTEPSLARLADVVDKESGSVRDSDFLFELVDAKGAFLAGNVRDIPEFHGWRWLKRADVFLTLERGQADDQFLATWRPLSSGRLLVGSSNREVRHIKAYLVRILGLAALGAMVVVGLSTAFLARGTERRLGLFGSTLDAVSQGKISARVPLTGANDDIDEIAEQVNRTLARLETLITNVNQSSSDIAHDLKKPIGRIRQRLDEACRSGGAVTDARSVIEAAIADLDSITETFDALLRITQIEAGGRRSRFKTIEIGELVADIADVYAPVAEDAGFSITSTIAGFGPFHVLGDEDLLNQLLANLIENAICHCPQGTHISLSVVEEGREIVVTVADTGFGIPEAERTSVFRRLYRLERARSTEGTGLGLSLVAAIADLHEAKVSLLDNHPGVKAEVRFASRA